MSTEVYEKWGFGLAPPKPNTQRERNRSAVAALSILTADFQFGDENSLHNLSTIKGLFSRAYRQDQWDWFTVKAQLGYPSNSIAKRISLKIQDLRTAFRDGDAKKGLEAWIDLDVLPIFPPVIS